VPVTFEFVLVGLIMHEASKFWRTFQKFCGSRLVTVLVRDQFLYFLVVIACSVASLLSCWLEEGLFLGVASGLSNASVPCVLGSRLLFNLHEAAERDLNGGSGTEIPTMSNMRFQ
ncbi:hypothetical protein DFH11DRAFT_1484686, partial [Phellopilus nigrolimitatus]